MTPRGTIKPKMPRVAPLGSCCSAPTAPGAASGFNNVTKEATRGIWRGPHPGAIGCQRKHLTRKTDKKGFGEVIATSPEHTKAQTHPATNRDKRQAGTERKHSLPAAHPALNREKPPAQITHTHTAHTTSHTHTPQVHHQTTHPDWSTPSPKHTQKPHAPVFLSWVLILRP